MIDMKQAQREQFVKSVFEAAKKLRAAGRKINPAVVAAQAALESNFGLSGLSRDAKNFFGIKAGKTWKGEVVSRQTKEYDKDKVEYSVTASFRKYPSIEACLSDYASIIETKSWYADAAANADDHAKYLKGILPKPNGEPGWATDPGYEGKILSLIKRYCGLVK